MKRKFIHLALAFLFSGVAGAQSNVQIYGTIDVGFSHYGDNIAPGVGSKNAIDSGVSADNTLGFRGVEDLGNGLKASFVLEADFTADDGQQADNRLFSQSFLGLSGGFGTLLVGRIDGGHYNFLKSYDPFADGTVGKYSNIYANLEGGGTYGLFNPKTADNTLLYLSPSWNGFNVIAAYMTTAAGQEGVANEGDVRVMAVYPHYVNGPLDVAIYAHRIDGRHMEKVGAPDITVDNRAVGGSYDFKVVKLSAFYDASKWKDFGGGNDDIKLNSWLVGASVPFGKHAVQASYIRSKHKYQGDSKTARQWALGYTYRLSKRTNFYAAYADISNDDGRAASVGDATRTGDADQYQNGLSVGLRHTF